jgi:hypothetical protein
VTPVAIFSGTMVHWWSMRWKLLYQWLISEQICSNKNHTTLEISYCKESDNIFLVFWQIMITSKHVPHESYRSHRDAYVVCINLHCEHFLRKLIKVSFEFDKIDVIMYRYEPTLNPSNYFQFRPSIPNFIELRSVLCEIKYSHRRTDTTY